MVLRKFRIAALISSFCAAFLIGTTSIMAQVPETMSYQGVLTQSNGSAVADGSYSLTFRLYYVTILIGPPPNRIIQFITDTLWTETQNVAVSKGIFNVILGSVNPINLPFDKQYWLGITVASGSELTPRIQLTSSPYSMRTEYADTALYVSGGGTGGSGITGITAGTGLTGGGTSGNVTLSAAVPFSLSGSSSNPIISGSNSNASTGSGVYGINTNSGNYGYLGDPSEGIYGYSASIRGVWGASSSGIGVLATSSSNNGVQASSISGVAVYGVNTNSDDIGELGNPSEGVYGHSISGYGLLATSNSSTGVYGSGTIGVEGQNTSDGNIYGELGTSTIGAQGSSDNDYGVYGFSSSSNTTLAGVGGADDAGYGVSGLTETGAGVFGQSSGSGYAGSFAGNVHISGSYTATGTKSAEVKLTNGTPVRLSCEEATGVYFADYGEGQLTGGKAHISLDPEFLQTVTIDAQHPMMVFVQVEGDCKGVYITNKTSTSFDVNELQGGTSSLSFSYRVVCKRKYFEDERLSTPAQDDAANRSMMEKAWPEVIAQEQQMAAKMQAMEQQQKAMQAKMNMGPQK